MASIRVPIGIRETGSYPSRTQLPSLVSPCSPLWVGISEFGELSVPSPSSDSYWILPPTWRYLATRYPTAVAQSATMNP